MYVFYGIFPRKSQFPAPGIMLFSVCFVPFFVYGASVGRFCVFWMYRSRLIFLDRVTDIWWKPRLIHFSFFYSGKFVAPEILVLPHRRHVQNRNKSNFLLFLWHFKLLTSRLDLHPDLNWLMKFEQKVNISIRLPGYQGGETIVSARLSVA